MKFACDSCQTKYTIPDDKVRGKVLKIRCKKCGAVITVKEEAAAAPPEPEAPPLEERTRVADIGLLEKLRQAEEARNAAPAPAPAPVAPPPAHEWYAMVNGEQVGPLGHDDFAAKVDSGEISDRSHVWRDGLADWKRAGEVDELQAMFAKPAPPPPAPRAPPPRAAPPPLAASPLDTAEDDVVPTRQAPRPDLNSLFGEEGAAGATGQSDLSAHADGMSNGHANGHAAPASKSGGLDHLLGDLGNDEDHEPTGAAPVSVGPDPFSSVPDAPGVQQPQIGEQTRFFMKKAGVTNRNPWWKYAIFVLLVLGLPVAAIYGLGKAGVGGTVVVIDERGEQKTVQRFSFDNLKNNGLGAMLSGTGPAAVGPVAPKQPKKSTKTADKAPTPVDPNAGDPKANLSDEDKKKLAQNAAVLSGDPLGGPTSSGPKERTKDKGKTPDVSTGGGLTDEVVAKVVADNTTGFNKCVEDHLKRDPEWRGGRVTLTVKIGPSGTVLDTGIDKASVSNSEVGDCLKGKAKRMHFPRFDGDEPQEVQFPLLLTNGG